MHPSGTVSTTMGQGPSQRDMVHPNRTRCTPVLSSFTRQDTGWGVWPGQGRGARQGWGTAALGAGMLQHGGDGEDTVFQMLAVNTPLLPQSLQLRGGQPPTQSETPNTPITQHARAGACPQGQPPLKRQQQNLLPC